MSSLPNLLLSGLFLSLLAASVLTEPQETCLSYRLETTKFIRVDKEECSKNILRFNFNFLWKPYKSLKNAYTLHIRDSEVTIDREITPEQINVGRCLSNVIPGTRSLQAALVVFDDNGLLKEIKVQKDEPEVVINVMLYLSSLLQVNKTLIGKSKTKDVITVKGNTTELLNLGQCPVSYEVARKNDKAGDNMRIVKKMILNECTSLKQEYKKLYGVSITEAKKIKDVIVPQLVLLNTTIAYKPWPTATWGAQVDINARITLKDTVPCQVVPSFVDDDCITVTSQHLKPLNRKVLFAWDVRNRDLTDIYRALASEGVATNIYQDFYERALRCWERI